MIRAFIFDLDGVLVQTEKLKARAYDLAVQEILGTEAPDQRAGQAYAEVIGASRETTSRYVMEKLGLEKPLRAIMGQYGVSTPWDALTVVRYRIYNRMVADPRVLRDNQWPYNVAVLKMARRMGCSTALTTLSKRPDVERVIAALDIRSLLDLVLTAEDVSRGKPDPEIYLKAAQRLGMTPAECLVLEDSLNGITAATRAGMNVIAMATPFTGAAIHAGKLVDDEWIIHRPEDVTEIIERRIAGLNRIASVQ
jgi:beta-phosphoglucomutase-like phosphatase (HAD superfamily)